MADRNYDVQIPDDGFGSELQSLSHSFARMSHRLAEVDESRTRMLADLAYEIRTPLATLEVYVDGMEDDVVPLDEQTYTVLRSQITRLQRLAHDVGDAAGAGQAALDINTAPVDVRHVVEPAVQVARPQFLAKDVTLTSSCTTQATELEADEQRLQQVLANTLSNALRHTPPGGHVHVTITDDGDGDYVQIRVTDDVQGIQVADLDRIFERFYRGDPSRKVDGDTNGSGLGLTIARAIATEHGGFISASSPGVGHGTTITIRLSRKL